MKTEIVKIIEAMNSNSSLKKMRYVEKLRENYHKYYENDIHQKGFIKRILNIFYPNDERYKQTYACMDDTQNK
jgi:hypothetical protein